jgi:hypothetical protein
MIVRCPKCGKETPYEGNPFRPFCSSRCKIVDLGNWASGSYRVPIETPPEEAAEESTDARDEESGEP